MVNSTSVQDVIIRFVLMMSQKTNVVTLSMKLNLEEVEFAHRGYNLPSCQYIFLFGVMII